MLIDMILNPFECKFCRSKDIIYGYRQLVNEEIIKIECECKKCGKIYFKEFNGEEYEELQEKEKNRKEAT